MGVPESHFQFPMVDMFQWKQKLQWPAQGERLRVLTWNILAERLVSQKAFPYVRPEHLCYDYRIDLVKRFITCNDCEILCLQEVDSTKSFFSFLQDLGYQYHYRPKGPLHGMLVAYKKSLFSLLDERVCDYDSLITPAFDRKVYSTGHGAIILKLLYKGMYKVIVANTHLFWVPRLQRIKYHQVCSALSEISKFSADDPDCFKLLAGDFNSLPGGNCVKLITNNCPPDSGICFEARKNYTEMNMKYRECSDKLLRMKSAFQRDECKLTNLTHEFRGVIDYVFYEEHENLKVNKILSLPEEEILQKELGLPSSQIPSDHLPLVCQFLLRNPEA